MLEGREEFSSHMYYLPRGNLDSSSMMIKPDVDIPFYLTDKWQKISFFFTIPVSQKNANADKNESFLVRPVFFEKSATPTIEIANITLTVYDVLPTLNGSPSILLKKRENAGYLIEKSDEYFKNGDVDNAFILLKKVEASDPDNLSIKWRLVRIYYRFAAESESKEEALAFSLYGDDFYRIVEKSNTLSEAEIQDIAKWRKLAGYNLH